MKIRNRYPNMPYTHGKIILNNLFDEMFDYSLNKKANIVFRKCVKNKRYLTALKIAIKYDINSDTSNTSDDLVMSTGLALLASNNS